METKKYWVIAVALLMTFMVGRWSIDRSPVSAKAETKKAGTGKVERSDVTVQQLQKVLYQNRKMTSLQREEVLSNYINKQVQWKGTLKSAHSSEGELMAVLSHRIKPTWPLGRRQVQVTVNFFPDSEKEKLLNAPKGSLVTYQGTLSEYTGSAKRPWFLTDGHIISVEIDQPEVRTD